MANFDVVVGNTDFTFDKNEVKSLFKEVEKKAEAMSRCAGILWEECDGEHSEIYDIQKVADDVKETSKAAFIINDYDGRYMMNVPKIIDVIQSVDIAWDYSCKIARKCENGNDFTAALARKLRIYANEASDATDKIRKILEAFI